MIFKIRFSNPIFLSSNDFSIYLCMYSEKHNNWTHNDEKLLLVRGKKSYNNLLDYILKYKVSTLTVLNSFLSNVFSHRTASGTIRKFSFSTIRTSLRTLNNFFHYLKIEIFSLLFNDFLNLATYDFFVFSFFAILWNLEHWKIR